RARGPRGNRGSGKGDPRQPDPGTRPSRYRCSLPGLTGFTTGRRGGTDADRRILPDPRRRRWLLPTLDLGPTLGYAAPLRRGGRAVEGACLESKCTVTPYRGFESHPL